ncbi:hypothetical protein [Rhizobium leguminosarum]|uniref:hypothetical protein n=1 Tax=Rhizobium leguminosarum TaxID=384 RepID=UPI001C944503|nr:hypothetical protein [Rhizobium leguminosarum]MBY5416420.1 hypothetical protein [Rhizobium leguminosarum]
MQTFRIIGLLLCAVLAGWIAWSLVTSPTPQPPLIADLGNAFEGNSQLSKEDIDASLSHAKSRMSDLNSTGRSLRLAGEIAGWISFACTAAITLVLGYFGRAPAAANTPIPSDGNGLPNRIARAIGVLAASAAILTAAGSMAKNSGQDKFDRSNTAAQIIREAQRAVGDAGTAREARDALDEMTRRVDQL